MKATVWTILETPDNPDAYRDHLAGMQCEWPDVFKLIEKWRGDGMAIRRSDDHDHGIIRFYATGGVKQPVGKHYERIISVHSRAAKTVDQLMAELFDTPGTQYDQELAYA